MKTYFSLFSLALCWLVAGGAAWGGEQQVFNLSMSSLYMEKHPVTQRAWLPWIEEVKQKSGGRLIITYFNPNTICPEGEIFDSVVRGQLDIGHNALSRNQGKFPVSVVLDIPSMLSSSLAGSEAAWRVYQEIPEVQKELSAVKILAMHTSPLNQINMNKGEIHKLEDLKNKKILTNSGDSGRMVRALGANPIVMPTSDFYLALSRSMGDGCLLPIAPLRAFKLNETVKSITMTNVRVSGFWFGMHWGVWEKLPPDLQKVFEETTGLKLALAAGRALYEADREDMERLQKEGVKLIQLAPQERARWVDLAEGAMKATWFEQLEKREIKNAPEIYARIQQIYKEVEAKQKAQ